jgi:hypothetical protein
MKLKILALMSIAFCDCMATRKGTKNFSSVFISPTAAAARASPSSVQSKDSGYNSIENGYRPQSRTSKQVEDTKVWRPSYEYEHDRVFMFDEELEDNYQEQLNFEITDQEKEEFEKLIRHANLKPITNHRRRRTLETNFS